MKIVERITLFSMQMIEIILRNYEPEFVRQKMKKMFGLESVGNENITKI